MLHTLLYFLALFCLSTSANWAKLSHMPVEILGFWRLSLAALLVGIWLLFKQRHSFLMKKRTFAWVALSGFFFFLHLATYKYAAKNTSISNTVILFASNPIWASLGAALFFQERITRRLVLSYVIALLGIYVLVRHQIQFSPKGLQGDISSLLSALFYAVYMLTGKKSRETCNNTSFSFFQYAICALGFAMTAFFTQAPFTGYDEISWFSVVGLIALPTFLGHFTLTYLVNFMNLNIMSCGKLLEPVIASIIAYFVFHETLNQNSWIAFLLTAISVLILFAPGILKRAQKFKNF